MIISLVADEMALHSCCGCSRRRVGRPFSSSRAAGGGLGIRFDAVANIIITVVAGMIAADSLLSAAPLSAGLAGMVLTQSLQLIGVFQCKLKTAKFCTAE